ncbi:MAG: hypothetical protein ACXV98_04450 [Ilumatobacteraceae bacterium]
MNFRRSLALTAATALVAFVAFGASFSNAAASTPPTSTPASPPNTQSGSGDQPGQITESWTLAPAATGDGGNRPNLSFLADPGAKLSDAITVYNFGNVSETFQVYATDAFNTTDGQFATLPGDKKPDDVGTWVTLPQAALTLLPGQQPTKPITINVPKDATPGDHVGAILASSPTEGTTDRGQAITLDRRTGTRLYVRVNGPLSPNLAVTDLTTSYHGSVDPFGGSATVSFRVENRGNVRLTGTPTVSVGGMFGIGERKLKLPEIAELLPGQNATFTAELENVPAVLFDVGKVRVEPHGATDLKPVSVKKTIFAPPITILVVVLVALIVVLLVRFRRRRLAGMQAPADLVAIPDQTEREHQLS